MKKILSCLLAALLLAACSKLDLNPPAQASTQTYYDNQTELELAVNDLYRLDFWGNDDENSSDNLWYRTTGGNSVTFGTMTSDDAAPLSLWTNAYKAIARVNAFIANKDKAASNTSAAVITKLEAEMRLIRAYEYSRLITHFGDVPFLTAPTELAEATGIERTDQKQIRDFIFSELDFAAANLPASYTTAEVRRLTKGAALAVKARTALYTEQWSIARDAAKQLIQLNVYKLHPDYAELFLKPGETSPEIIISVPRDQAQQVYNGSGYVLDFISRNAGGFGAYVPTRELFDAYECTDGLPIDESPRYNPLDPFKNRDPRLTATIVEFNTQWLGFSYQPHPDSLTVFSSKTNLRVSNRDTRSVANFASPTGFLWKKGIDQSWADRQAEDNDAILYRYAEILLIYAEAKIQLSEIDDTVLDAINQVKARAYGVTPAQTTLYPAVTTTDVAQLRKIVRRERRVEFVREGLRYMDLIRWRLAEKALTKPVIGLPDPANQNRSKWPFPGVTPLDDDGIADYSGFSNDVKVVAQRAFDKNKQYLWPLPSIELRVNPKLTQNPNY